MLATWKKSYDQPRQYFKKQRHCFAYKGPYKSKLGFFSSHLWTGELDHKESWVPKKKAENSWTVMLETFESPLNWKKIKLVNPKENQSCIFIGGTNAEVETPILWLSDMKNWFIGKDPDAGKDWRQEEKGMTEDEMVGWHHQLDGHVFEKALRVGDEQGSLACGRKESDTTELNWMRRTIYLKVILGFMLPIFKFCHNNWHYISTCNFENIWSLNICILSAFQFSSVQFSCSVMSNSLRPHELQHAKLPCPSLTPGAYPNSCPLSRWCHPTISSSVVPFSSCPQCFPASGSFQMSQLFTSGGQSIGASASTSVLPMNTQEVPLLTSKIMISVIHSISRMSSLKLSSSIPMLLTSPFSLYMSSSSLPLDQLTCILTLVMHMCGSPAPAPLVKPRLVQPEQSQASQDPGGTGWDQKALRSHNATFLHNFYLFSLHRIFLALHGLSVVAASRGYSLLQ